MTPETKSTSLGDRPIGDAQLAAPPHLADAAAEAAAASSVATAGYVELDETYAELQERVARAEIEAGAPLPIDPQNLVDARMLAAIDERAAEVHEATTAYRRASDALVEEERLLAATPLPPAMLKRLLRAVLTFGIIAIGAAAVGSFMVGGVDTYLFRNHFIEVFGEDSGRRVSLYVASAATFVTAFVVLATPMIVVFLRHGMVGVVFKIVFLIAELGFALAFTLLRAQDGALKDSIPAGALEASICLVVLALPFFLAGGLAEERTRTLAWRARHRLRKCALQARTEAEAALSSAKTTFTAQMAVVEARDLAGRKRAAWVELATSTRLLSYVTATAAAQSSAAKASDATHRDFVENIRRHLTDEAKRAKARLEAA